MDQIGGFAYQPADSMVHRLDVRCKFLMVCILALSVFQTGFPALGILLATQFLLLRHLGISLQASLYELRFFLIFLVLIVGVRALVVPGTPLLTVGFLVLSRQGCLEGIVLAVRMLVVVFLGQILIATTRPAEIKAAVEWFLKPLPGVPAARIGTMLGLLLRFMPLIFLQASKTRDAQRARGIENRKNPIYRLTRFSLPFLRCTFESADRLTLAMAARGYRDRRTPPRLAAGAVDWAALVLTLLVGLLLWVL